MNPEADDHGARSGQRLVAFYEQKPRKLSDVLGVDQLQLRRAHDFDLRSPAVASVVYVTHPGDDRRLVPFADYDEELARDKLNEALRVVNALGASRVVAKANRGRVSRADGRVGRRTVGVRIGGGSASTWDVAYEQRGAGGPPTDPRPLLYPDEPGLDTACDAVLRNGTRSLKIEILRRSQFGVDGELAIRLRKAGFKLGVGGSRTLNSQFVIEARFGPESAHLHTAEAASSDFDDVDAEGRPDSWLRRQARRITEGRDD